MIIIDAKNIRKSYGNLQILKGVNLQVQKGEIVTIVGKSGAGKSTLLHILGALDTVDSGELTISGKNLTNTNQAQQAGFRNQKIGFVFQFHHLLPEFDALENVMMPGLIAKSDVSALRKRATELLEYLGMGHRLHHKPTELSGGEQQRVAFARALINAPDLILADEPTGNLDSTTSNELHQLILQLRKDYQQTFVIVTHNAELAKLSDRSLEMHDGQLKG